MTTTTAKLLSLIIGLIYVPWWLYLYYLILQKVGGTDLMWFLFWSMVPMSFVLAILSKIVEWEKED